MTTDSRPFLGRRDLPRFLWTLGVYAVQRRVMRLLDKLGERAG